MRLTKHFNTRQTPQTEPIPGKDMAKNSAGGYSFKVDKWGRLDRFLILGSEGGSYYASEKKLTVDNANVALDCVQEDGVRVVNRVVEISDSGRAPKNDPALFVLAMCLKLGDDKTKVAAREAMPKVARIGTHLFALAEAVEAFGGWGRSTKRAFADWYLSRKADNVAFQAMKYQSRNGWSHVDVLRLAHAKPTGEDYDAVFRWITKGWQGDLPSEAPQGPLRQIWAFERAKAIGNSGSVTKDGTREIVSLISGYNLPRECIPTQYLNEVAIWEALLDNGGRGMPLTAMIRNLAKMTSIGLIGPMNAASKKVVAALSDEGAIKKARVHPLQMLVALNTYNSGRGVRGSLTWTPVSQIVDALDRGFYLSFGAVESTGKRTMLALDVSASMGWNSIAGMPGITPAIGSAAMSMVTAASEPEHLITAFSHGIVPIHGISPRMRLDSVVRQISQIPMGGTDCSLPMLYAEENKIPVDTFILYTDSETGSLSGLRGRYGSIHPVQALDKYQQTMGIPARMIVVGMVSNEFTIGDGTRGDCLGVVGFDTAAPNIMAAFSKGEF